MSVAAVTEVYVADSGAVMARGVAWTEAELTAALRDPVAGLLRDDVGREEVRTLLAGLADTAFAAQRLQQVLDAPRPPLEDWRVGEALAEAILVAHRQCTFPWPVIRDLRNPGASPAGCDLVGFVGDDDSACLAFGEVKTSEEQASPPQVMKGRHGMAGQLEELRDKPEVKNWLFLYLAHRSKGAPWEKQFRVAGRRFLADATDVVLLGVLVRDVSPNPADLAGRAKALSKGCPKKTVVELRALYLAAGAIQTLAVRAQAAIGSAP